MIRDDANENGNYNSRYQINWDVPEGYRKISYGVGLNGELNRLLCLKFRDLTRRKIKPKVIDRYPPLGSDRNYYPFP
jgi:hypothetical protein